MATSSKQNTISEIQSSTGTYQITGRIIYVSEQILPKTREVTKLDFILMDSEGGEIHVTLAKRLFFKHKSSVKEGAVRCLTNFDVKLNNGDYRITKHPFRIDFNAKTIFKVATDFNIPDHRIEFASFDDITQKNIDANYLVDVIGELNGRSKIELTTSNIPTMRIELVDCKGRKLICTLWQHFAEEMDKIISSTDGSNQKHIIIIRYAKIKAYKDSVLSNSLSSKLLVDAEIPEVREFIKRRADSGLLSSPTCLTQLSSHSESITNELLDLSIRRTIEDIKETQEVGYYVTLATITAIDTKYRWYLEICNACKSSVELDDTGKWLCTGKCANYAKSVVIRYKVRVNVADNSGSAIFILFDTLASELLSLSAKQLRDNQLKHGDLDTYPQELDVLLNRKFIFKIKVDERYNLNLGWKSYGVNFLSEDSTLIKKYQESTQLPEKIGSELDLRDESTIQSDREKESVHSTVDDESVTSAVNLTPTKRLLDKFEVVDDAQLSVTKKHMRK